MIDLKPAPVFVERYYRAGYWQGRSLDQWIDDSVTHHADKVAVQDASGYSMTYRELEDKASRFAAFLSSRGVGAGDVVTMHLPNWWQTAVVTYATFKLGAVINPLPPTYGWKDLAFVMNKSDSKAVIVPGKFRSEDYTEHLARIQTELTTVPTMVVIGTGKEALGTTFDEALSGPRFAEQTSAAPDAPCLLLFTSGSESKPKGVVHTHNTAIYGERVLSSTLHLDSQDVCFMASPVTHTSGFMHGILMTLMTGARLSLLDVFKGDAAVDQMIASRATWTMGATPFLNDVVESLERSGKRLPDLRYFLCGGAPIPEVIVRRAQKIGVRVLSIYGSTESPPHTVTWPSDPIEAAWQADGRVLPGIEVCAVDSEGNRLAPGQQGEQWSRGPHAFIGYLDEPELTARALDAEGWCHSGDLATVGADGSVRIVGRIKDMIIRGGQNISAREVEDILMEHPACQSVAVIGLPDERLGELGCAVVVCKSGRALGFEDMKQFLIDRGVARFKLPQYLVLRDALPATPSGKVQKFKLREELKTLNGAPPMFKVDVLGPIVRITMQREPVNAISNEFVAGFMQVLDGLANKQDMAVLHLRSNQKAFCAGADLAQVQRRFSLENGADVMVQDIRGFHQLFDRIEALPCVTLAEIAGSALGGGFELALACDLRIASASAKMGLPEAKLGLIPGAGGTQRLTRLCGLGTAARIILACDVVDGATACQLGMVQWAVAPGELAQQAEALVQRMAELSAPALRVAKRCIAQAAELAAEGFEAELQGIHALVTTVEAQTRIKEFLVPRTGAGN